MTYWLIGRLAAGTVLAALAAGCGSSTPAAHAPSAAPAASVPASSAAAATGPFKIKVLYCGPFSKAQQNEYEDYSGLIFKYTNVSDSVVGSPVLSVNFTKGSTVTGSNVNGSEPNISPGQSAFAVWARSVTAARRSSSRLPARDRRRSDSRRGPGAHLHPVTGSYPGSRSLPRRYMCSAEGHPSRVQAAFARIFKCARALTIT